MLYFGLADQVAGQPKALLLLEPPSFNPKCQEKFLCHKIYKGFNTLSHIIFTVSRIGELETASPILIFFIVVIIVVLLCGWAFMILKSFLPWTYYQVVEGGNRITIEIEVNVSIRILISTKLWKLSSLVNRVTYWLTLSRPHSTKSQVIL